MWEETTSILFWTGAPVSESNRWERRRQPLVNFANHPGDGAGILCHLIRSLANEPEGMPGMRPYIICHMLSSIDGKIDGSALESVMAEGDYEATGEKLKGDAWICGRTTMQLHFAEKTPFVPKSKKPAGARPVSIARQAKSYAICIDTLGKLRWSGGDLDGDHLICVVSEKVTEDYLAMLQKKGVSYIVSGKSGVDLADAVRQLGSHFGIRTLLLEGGGRINGGFLQAGLVDELSLLIVPGIDGRHRIPAIFDGLNSPTKKADPLKLISVERRKRDTLWLRYALVKSKTNQGTQIAKAKIRKK